MNAPVRIPLVAAPVKGGKCSRCTGSWCCTYVTHALDTPRSMEDFDYLLWMVSHESTQIYKDEDGWFLLVDGRCTHLAPDGRCGIYEKRPKICRTHDDDDCESEGLAREEDFELYFPTYAALETYCRKRFKGWDQRFD